MQPDGVVLRGTMSFGRWRAPVAATDSMTVDRNGQPALLLDAYASWIPGGGIQSYRWRDGTSTVIEQHQFMTTVPPPGPGTPPPWCIEVTGWQTTDTGDTRVVTASVCRVAVPSFGVLPEAARRFERSRLHHTLVLDPERTVARALEVHCWPTAIWLDERGRVDRIQMGAEHHADALAARTSGMT